MIRKLFLIFATACIIDKIVLASPDKIICYHGIWSVYKQGDGKFTVEDIDPMLCTHAVYAFVGIDEDGHVTHLDRFLDVNKGNLIRFNALKLRNNNLKTLVAISESQQLSAVARNDTKRVRFVESILSFVQEWSFDGFDFDWELPVQGESGADDKANFAILVGELKEEFGKRNLLLTAAISASLDFINFANDVPTLFQDLDIINVMMSDFNNSALILGQTIPMSFSSAYATQSEQLFNVDATIREWINAGVDPQKITIGLETSGKAYTLSDNSSLETREPYITDVGVVGYNKIVKLKTENGWINLWDPQLYKPYMFKDDQWITYENPRSIGHKVDYAKSLQLGGVAVWRIETDDFKGTSGTDYPLLLRINQVMGRVAEEEGNPAPVPGVGIQNVCTKEGYVRDPIDCGIYYYCLLHNNQFLPVQLKCVTGLHFDEEAVKCDYPENVPC